LSHGAQVDAHGFNNEAETPLDMAVADGFQAVVEVLLANKADVNAQERSGKTPLYLAAQRGDPEIVSLLLDQKSDVNLADGAGSTPLFAAVTAKHPEIVKSLIAAGAQVNLKDDTGRTPLSYAAENDSPEILKMLLAAKADPNGGTFESPLLAASLKQNTAAAELLLGAGADPNAVTKINVMGMGYSLAVMNHEDHLTPLWLAVSLDQFPMVQLLLKFKADPNDLQTDENSLLFDALSDTNILQALLDAGAKVDWSRNSSNWTPLVGAIAGNHADAVKILLKHGANPHVQFFSDGDAPLHLAARKLADTNIFLALLDYQADPNVRNSDGATPLDLLKTSSSRTLAGQLADLLRQHGALDKLPDWNHIIVSRPAAGFSAKVFEKGTNDWNRFTLLEALVEFYKPPQLQLSFEARLALIESGASAPQDALPFPDLAHVTIVRPQSGSTNEARLQVNLLNSTNGIDCSRDVALEFGDVVEIPEYNHPLDSQHIGLTDAQYATMKNDLIGQAELLTQGQKVELPFHFYEDGSLIGQVLGQTQAQRVLESSSDLSRVKVTRHDPKTGQAQSWILDCSNLGATSDLRARFGSPARMPGNQASATTPDFRVRDGDVIEVPQKSE
jgi:ankyrin repeat protein